jgi:hypothetical protein
MSLVGLVMTPYVDEGASPILPGKTTVWVRRNFREGFNPNSCFVVDKYYATILCI